MPSLRIIVLIFLASLVSCASGFAQKKDAQPSDKFAIFVVSNADASAVTKALVRRLNDSKPFVSVSKDDLSKAIVLVDCMHRVKAEQPFICIYVVHYNGVAFKTMVGAGEYISGTAADMASNLLGAIASDIVERWDETNKRNLKESLEACLFLTDSKCNVPTPLQAELGEKQLTLGHYMFINSENAGALYTRYVDGEDKLAKEGLKVATECTDILKKEKEKKTASKP
jgi:hypothetical protein